MLRITVVPDPVAFCSLATKVSFSVGKGGQK
jgi:hypothetical protein